MAADTDQATSRSSSRRRISPLRLRLLGLVAIAFFPLVLLVVRLASDERRATALRERDTSLRLLDVALAEHRDLTRTGLEFLRHLPGMTDIAAGDGTTCSRSVRDLLSTYANFTNVVRITPSLSVDCSAVTVSGDSADISRDPAILRAAATGRPVSSWIRHGPLGQPLATIIEPVRDSSGGIAYYLSTEAELTWFNRLVRAIPRAPGSMAAIVDTTGFILARQPDDERFAGSRHTPAGPLLDMIGHDSGFVEGVGLDGVARLYAFRSLPVDNASPVLLMVGVPTSMLYADANRHLVTYLGLLLVMLVLTVLMAWIAADLFIIRDVRALLGATERLADGDLSTRVIAPSSSGELNDLAIRFNDLARRLEERRREFVLLGDSSPDAIARVTRDMEIEWANAALRTRLGAGVDDITGCQLEDLRLEPALISAVSHQVREVFDTGRRRESEQFVSTSEGDSWIDLRVTPERNAAGEITHAMVIARDVTARRQLASHLAQAERLDSIGKLAGHIAHDFNNLLTAIIGNAEIALRQLEPTDRVAADVAKIMDVSRRASSLTRQLLSFARRQSTTTRVIDVKNFIEEVTPLLRRVIGDQIRLDVHFDVSTPNIMFDPTQLEQVLVNLAANARDAMPGGGTLSISTSRRVVDQDETTIDGRVPGDYLVLTVSDTGVGMSAEVRQRIFEPFFSTKHGQGGTGLGLAVAYGAVRQHGASIEVESAEHHGATFRIFVPATATAPEKRPPPEVVPDAPRGRETILLAEDQDDVRSTLARLLRSHGYVVIDTPDGADAIRKIESGEMPPFQLLITDLVMPKVGGESLVAAIRPIFPDVPVLVISGFDQQGSLRRMYERGHATAFLEKPFEGQPMLKLVRDLLDARITRPPTPEKVTAIH
jgi:two-component system, cell cycle sensor histidine kinase and response regulator CckA